MKKTVTLNPGESKVVGFIFTPTTAKGYTVSVDGLAGSFAAIAPEELIDAEYLVGYVKWDGWEPNPVMLENQWPADTDITLCWIIKNTGTVGGYFRVYMRSFTEWVYLEPGEQAEVYEETHSPSPQTTTHHITLSGGKTIAEARLIWDEWIEVTYTALAPPYYWLRPTGHIPGRWNDEELAYDGWTDTRAEVVDVGTQSWSPYLELTIEPTEISAVRWWGSSPVSPKTVQVDVRHYDGTYHNIYEGSAVVMWDDGLPIPGGARVISGARIRFYNIARTIRMKFRVNEFQFYGIGEPPEPPEPIPTTKLYGYVTNRYTGAPIAGAHGKVYQEYDTEGDDYDLVTDSSGYYLIDNMTPDAVLNQMVIYADGYKTYTNEDFNIWEGDNQRNIRMTPE